MSSESVSDPASAELPTDAVSTAPEAASNSEAASNPEAESGGGEHSRAEDNASASGDTFAYRSDGFFDEMFDERGQPRTSCEDICQRLGQLSREQLIEHQRQAELAMVELGVTFRVYEKNGDGESVPSDRIFPFDVLPRVLELKEWQRIEEGLKQRIAALNDFLDDIYHDQHILNEGVVPRELVETSKPFLKQCIGLNPPRKIWCHITGTDLVRDADGTMYVLEDNLRVPSGVSYVLENRQMMKQTMPELFGGFSVASVEDYPERLLQTLSYAAPPGVHRPEIVVLTPGQYNSAYFEHSFLAQEMGVELVQGSDLVVEDRRVFKQTTQGLQPVHVIYRRIDDTFLDPQVFNADSVLGVPGLMEAYRAGNVTLANAPGNGVADDKAIYAYVPEIIKFYRGSDAILPNVPTFVCSDPKHRQHVLANLDKMVVKPTNESGGYGLLIGPQASKTEREHAAEGIKADPRNFIAQEMLTLSTVPTLFDGQPAPRHVDLRPFVLQGKVTYVLPGGLTRVALREGSTVVNSSQGGGSKDTWVLASDAEVNVAAREAERAPLRPPGQPIARP